MAKKTGTKTEAPEAKVPKPPSITEQVLALEGPITAEARAYPVSDGSDAPKHGLMGVASAISQFRNALETNGRLERP